VRRSDDHPSAQKVAVTERLEQEFAFLARSMEAINRKRAYPLERAHYLLLLRLADGPCSVGTLATGLALDDSTVTRQVAAMEKAGLVARRTNPADRRSTLIEPTREGAARAKRMRAQRLARIAALFSGWEEADRAALADLLARVNHQLAETLATIEPDEAEAETAASSG
jgi:DNA-binding MarR family transcriptional regulator